MGRKIDEFWHTGILLMVQKSGEHQLRLVVYPIVYKVLYISGGCLGFLNHQHYHPRKMKNENVLYPVK